MLSSDSILQQGDPRLRRQAQSVVLAPANANLNSMSNDGLVDGFQQLIDDLLALTVQSNGVGIAAPQVGISERLFIVASRPNARYPEAPEMEPTAMINPRLLDRSDQQVSGWEGCLSVSGQRGWVPRAEEIEVEYLDRRGDRQTAVYKGFIARIFQHELDHLEGILFPDRVEKAEDLVSEVEFLEQISRRD